MDALWPQEPGDAAHEAFYRALFRLRKLLGAPQTVQVSEGRVSLDRSLVWGDLWAFEQTLSDGSRAPQALGLYSGDFLSDELDQPWAASTRERVRAKFLHQVGRQGAAPEAAQRWDEGIALYLRGLDAEPLTESFYQRLMRCYAAQGLRAEAAGVYRRAQCVRAPFRAFSGVSAKPGYLPAWFSKNPAPIHSAASAGLLWPSISTVTSYTACQRAAARSNRLSTNRPRMREPTGTGAMKRRRLKP
jgi:DNA-binding SARP family transcriptional activator